MEAAAFPRYARSEGRAGREAESRSQTVPAAAYRGRCRPAGEAACRKCLCAAREDTAASRVTLRHARGESQEKRARGIAACRKRLEKLI